MQRLWLMAVGVAMLAALPMAVAHAESEAPALRPDVVAAGHEPAVVQPHTQWRGFLTLAPGSNVTGAFYQVCRVGAACFAPPTAAVREGATFRFDTSDYKVAGRPVDYQPGWRLGVVWLLNETAADGTATVATFPDGPDLSSPGCAGDAAASCAEAHYLAFDVAAAPHRSPAPGPGLMALAAGAVAVLRRQAYRRS